MMTQRTYTITHFPVHMIPNIIQVLCVCACVCGGGWMGGGDWEVGMTRQMAIPLSAHSLNSGDDWFPRTVWSTPSSGLDAANDVTALLIKVRSVRNRIDTCSDWHIDTHTHTSLYNHQKHTHAHAHRHRHLQIHTHISRQKNKRTHAHTHNAQRAYNATQHPTHVPTGHLPCFEVKKSVASFTYASTNFAFTWRRKISTNKKIKLTLKKKRKQDRKQADS